MVNSGYNDAWETPAWTAQNMAYPPPNRDVLNFPTDVETVTLTGHFRDGSGRANGWFEIDNGDTVLTHPGTKEWIRPLKQRVEIRDGVLNPLVTVPAVDSPALQSDGPWGYHIRISIAGRLFKEGWDIPLLRATPLVDVFDLTFAPQSPTGIEIGGSEGDGFSLGAEPKDLNVNLTTGADFNSTLTNSDGWAGATISLVFANGETWTAVVDGNNATFAVDKVEADLMPAGTPVKLVVDSGVNDEVWAVGTVVRYG